MPIVYPFNIWVYLYILFLWAFVARFLILMTESKGSFFLYLQNFFYTSKLFLNSQKILWPFNKTCRHHTPKIMSTSGNQNISWKSISKSQNISPEVDFQKSKCITGSQLPKVKNHHRKSTSESQIIFPKVDFRKSKKFFGSWLP